VVAIGNQSLGVGNYNTILMTTEWSGVLGVRPSV
jgi:hypothetical protein